MNILKLQNTSNGEMIEIAEDQIKGQKALILNLGPKRVSAACLLSVNLVKSGQFVLLTNQLRNISVTYFLLHRINRRMFMTSTILYNPKEGLIVQSSKNFNKSIGDLTINSPKIASAKNFHQRFKENSSVHFKSINPLNIIQNNKVQQVSKPPIQICRFVLKDTLELQLVKLNNAKNNKEINSYQYILILENLKQTNKAILHWGFTINDGEISNVSFIASGSGLKKTLFYNDHLIYPLHDDATIARAAYWTEEDFNEYKKSLKPLEMTIGPGMTLANYLYTINQSLTQSVEILDENSKFCQRTRAAGEDPNYLKDSWAYFNLIKTYERGDISSGSLFYNKANILDINDKIKNDGPEE